MMLKERRERKKMNHKQLMFYEIMKVLEYVVECSVLEEVHTQKKVKSTSELYLCHYWSLFGAVKDDYYGRTVRYRLYFLSLECELINLDEIFVSCLIWGRKK